MKDLRAEVPIRNEDEIYTSNEYIYYKCIFQIKHE